MSSTTSPGRAEAALTLHLVLLRKIQVFHFNLWLQTCLSLLPAPTGRLGKSCHCKVLPSGRTGTCLGHRPGGRNWLSRGAGGLAGGQLCTRGGPGCFHMLCLKTKPENRMRSWAYNVKRHEEIESQSGLMSVKVQGNFFSRTPSFLSTIR